MLPRVGKARAEAPEADSLPEVHQLLVYIAYCDYEALRCFQALRG